MKQKLKFLSIIFLVFNFSCHDKTSKADNYALQIDSLLATTVPRSFNGVMLITQNGETKYSKAIGYSDFENKIPISIEDNFRIQSNSKQVAAVLVLKEVENGKIDLDSPIAKYLPDLQATWADTVTVHQLLNMSSGIIDINKPLIFPPGTNYKYSNPAYSLLGRIIEQVKGISYIEAANDLFNDLNMTKTYCFEKGKHAKGLINGYRCSEGNYEKVIFDKLGFAENGWLDFIPAGGIISNLKDLTIWDQKLHKDQILKPEMYKRMITYSITGQHDAFGNENIGYGYGVRVDNNIPVQFIGHAGKGMGFTSLKLYLPESDIDVVMLENVYNEKEDIVYYFEKEIKEIMLNFSLLSK